MEPTTALNHKLNNDATRLGEDASDVAEDLLTRTQDAWDSVKQQTNRAVRESSAYVHKNPVPIALAAFGFGLVLGLFLNRRHPVSFKNRYLAEPLHQSRGVLLGLLVACSALLRRTISSASGAAEEIAENVSDGLQDSLKPLRKAALLQTERKLGL
jgi:ElaB/YqjD/DUF883 family membrane-anchored ribosome-binding protein